MGEQSQPTKRSRLSFFGRAWAYITNALDVQQLVAFATGVGWKILFGGAGVLISLIVALVGHFPLWAWIVAPMVGAAFGLFFWNEWTSWRLRRRHLTFAGSTQQPVGELELDAEYIEQRAIEAEGTVTRLTNEITTLRAELQNVESSKIQAENELELRATRFNQEFRPKLVWADRLIARESTYPLFDQPMIRCHIKGRNHLTDPQPYFELVIELPYRGVMRLMVGHTFKGDFGFDGTKFKDAPKVIERPVGNQDFPFEGDGPATAWVVLRQYVLGRQDEIAAYMDRYREITFDTNGMELSVRIVNPIDGATMFERNVLQGGELTVQVPHGS